METRERRTAQGYIEKLGARLSLEIVQIPGGTFTMGAPEIESESRPTERPTHRVTVENFCMGRYPVTQAQWRFVAELETIYRKLNPNPAKFQGNNRPIERVSLHDAIEFCARLSRYTGREYSLPSEAQWEYACRAGTTTPFHFGEIVDPAVANYDGNYTYGQGQKGVYRRQTAPAGGFEIANEFGLYDMHGNVWEWCLDHWHANYQGAPGNGSAWCDTKASVDAARVLRGGSWFSYPRDCRSAFRHWCNAGHHDSDIGFRVISRA
ncbi:MAG: Sulphatase-modifying factor protein [Alkalinema sp. CACIAM 70d]|nr:MAG: Sulphatase-modifying factor protein [Alkalinema sp. CACIAM 70d]